MDRTVYLFVEGGDGCTLLANELLVGAITLLLNARSVLLRPGVNAARPSDVPGRVNLLAGGDVRSSPKFVDTLRSVDVGDMAFIGETVDSGVEVALPVDILSCCDAACVRMD